MKGKEKYEYQHKLLAHGIDNFKEHSSVERSKGSGPKKIQVQVIINLVLSQIENYPQTSMD